MALTVSQVAALARVSVRALHHYDAIGLLTPSARTDAGYRLYGDADLERLQQILFYRELGFPLEEIRRVLTDPAFDRREALLMQRELLQARARQNDQLLSAVDQALAALEKGTHMKGDEMFGAFSDEARAYQAEAQERWGDTDAWKTASARTARYKGADWQAMRADADATALALAELLQQGVPATAARATALAEQHRQHIERWFYPCSSDMHVALGQMYAEDARFRDHYDRTRPGLAVYLRDAIAANAAQRGAR